MLCNLIKLLSDKCHISRRDNVVVVKLMYDLFKLILLLVKREDAILEIDETDITQFIFIYVLERKKMVQNLEKKLNSTA